MSMTLEKDTIAILDAIKATGAQITVSFDIDAMKIISAIDKDLRDFSTEEDFRDYLSAILEVA